MPHPIEKTKRKHIALSKRQKEHLQNRSNQLGISLKHQITDAMKAELLRSEHQTRDGKLFVSDNDTVSYPFSPPEDLFLRFKARAKNLNLELKELFQIAIEHYLAEEPRSNDSELREVIRREIRQVSFEQSGPQISLYHFDEIPCGPTKEATEECAQPIFLPAQWALDKGIQNGDWEVNVRGDSMKGVGICDGDTLYMRPIYGLRPRFGTVTLVCCELDNGRFESTIKHWCRDETGRACLLDGDMKPAKLPFGVVNLHPLAVKIAHFKKSK